MVMSDTQLFLHHRSPPTVSRGQPVRSKLTESLFQKVDEVMDCTKTQREISKDYLVL